MVSIQESSNSQVLAFDSIKCILALITFENNVCTSHEITTGQCLMFYEFYLAVETLATFFTNITFEFQVNFVKMLLKTQREEENKSQKQIDLCQEFQNVCPNNSVKMILSKYFCPNFYPYFCPNFYPNFFPNFCPSFCPQFCQKFYPQFCPKFCPNLSPIICPNSVQISFQISVQISVKISVQISVQILFTILPKILSTILSKILSNYLSNYLSKFCPNFFSNFC